MVDVGGVRDDAGIGMCVGNDSAGDPPTSSITGKKKRGGLTGQCVIVLENLSEIQDAKVRRRRRMLVLPFYQ